MLLVLATAAEDTGAHPQQKELPSDVASGPTYAPAKPASAQDDSSEPKLKAPPKSPPLPLPKPPSSSSAAVSVARSCSLMVVAHAGDEACLSSKVPKGRAKKRLQYNRRFVNVQVGVGKKKGPNTQPLGKMG